MSSLPLQLRDARQWAALTQAELATRLGCSQPRVSAIETGKAGMSVERLRRWAEACGCVLAIKKMDDGC